jgi:DNA polymerase III gamma/tau subunit
MNLLTDYKELDEEERKRFAQVGHEYLIEQLQIYEQKPKQELEQEQEPEQEPKEQEQEPEQEPKEQEQEQEQEPTEEEIQEQIKEIYIINKIMSNINRTKPRGGMLNFNHPWTDTYCMITNKKVTKKLKIALKRTHFCECIVDEVFRAMRNWKSDEMPQFKNRGVTNIFECVNQTNNWNALNDHGKKVILEVLRTIEYKDTHTCSNNIYMPEFVVRYYNLNYDQAMVILHSVENEYTEHGGGQRNPWLNENGKQYVEKYDDDKTIFNSITQFCDNLKWGEVNDVRSIVIQKLDTYL